MKRYALCVIWCGLLISDRTVLADLTASIFDTDLANGGTRGVYTTAGGTFSIVVHLSTRYGVRSGNPYYGTEMNLVSGQFKIQDLNSSGIFNLTARSFYDDADVTDPPYEWSNDPGDELAFSAQTLGSPTYLSSDIGTLTEDPSLTTGTHVPILGGIDFANITVTISPTAAPGIYNLNLADLVFGDTDFDAIGPTKYAHSPRTGQYYRVTIYPAVAPVPAPGAWLIGAIGLGLVGWVKKRTQTIKSKARDTYGYGTGY